MRELRVGVLEITNDITSGLIPVEDKSPPYEPPPWVLRAAGMAGVGVLGAILTFPVDFLKTALKAGQRAGLATQDMAQAPPPRQPAPRPVSAPWQRIPRITLQPNPQPRAAETVDRGHER